MQILFIHQNFPGQWMHLARHYAASPAHTVVALTDRSNKIPDIIRTCRYDMPAVDFSKFPEAILRFSNNYTRASAAAQAMLSLKQEGFSPDLVAGHCGWGETLLVKEIWPKTKLLIYGEFYYRSQGADVNFDPEFQDKAEGNAMHVEAYNATSTLAMASSDAVLTPTRWQRDTFPSKFHSQISVVHDGVDTDKAKPNPAASIFLGRDQVKLTCDDEVITFISRNLEPYRGYHIFMRALPEIMRRRPKARVIIIGGDHTSYGARPPPGQSWKKIFLDEVVAGLDMSRIHFVGRVPHNILWDALAVSSCHVYLTYPFVLSWSLLEAMSIGCLIVGSKTAPVEELITHGVNGLLVDFFSVTALADQIVDALDRRAHYAPLRVAARQTIVQSYDLKRKSLPRLTRLFENVAARRR